MSKLIIMEGLDGSGKSTQTALLEEYFRQSGISYKKIKLPDYEKVGCAVKCLQKVGQQIRQGKDNNIFKYASCGEISFHSFFDRMHSAKIFQGIRLPP